MEIFTVLLDLILEGKGKVNNPHFWSGLQVRGVVRLHPSLTRISFVAHSLGGLIARYAVSALYTSLPLYHPSLVGSNLGRKVGEKTREGTGKAR
jgi:hypothetical protein